MPRVPLLIVFALAFLAGGAVAVALYYSPPGDAEVRGVPADSAGLGRGGGSVPRPGDVIVESSFDAGGAAESEDAAGYGADAHAGRVRVRAVVDRRAGASAGAARGYARVSRGDADRGGRGLTGHAVGGVKKSGEGVKKAGVAIGKTFGKIGGVFHD